MNLHRITKMFFVLAVCIFALIQLQAISAQQTTGDILGTVTDSSGALLPGAQVTIENLGTHEVRKEAATSSGEYVVNLLQPGNYRVTVIVGGFQQFVVPSLALSAGDRTRVNAQLTVGSSTQTITVDAQPSALQTDSSVLSTTINEKATQNLPLNGRNFIQLVQVTPGVNEGPPNGVTNGSGFDDQRQSSSISVNGQSDVVNNEMIDGADNNERLIGTAAVRPPIDSIREISVQTNTYTAEVGRTGGGIINVITKSGSDQFHGDVFEFFRNDLLNANTFNFGANLPKAELRQNQFGASLGGPLFRGKTFFFGGYEGYRLVSASAPAQYVVPTVYERQHPGDFSDTGGPVLAAGQIDPVALDYFRLYPAPNSGASIFTGASKNTQNSDSFDVRVDHAINVNNPLYARFIYNNVHSNYPGPFPNATSAGVTLNPNGLGYDTSHDQDYDGLLDYIHIFNSRLLAEFKASYTRVTNQAFPQAEGQNPNQVFGQPNVNTTISDQSGLAPILVLAGTGLGSTIFLPLTDGDNTFQYLGAVTYTRGAHNIKIGATVIRRQLTSFQSSYGEGLWIFLDYPGLLQGQYLNTQRSLSLVNPHLRTWEPAGYVQDDWHVSKTLTLNLGFRYDLYTPYTEIQNRISTWDPAGKFLVAGQNGVSNTAGIQTDYKGFAPRIGFALSPRPGSVLRGGYGIGYFPENTTSSGNLKNQPFVATVSSCGFFSCGPGFFSFANGFPVPAPSSITSPGASIPDATDTHFRTSSIQQFNLTAQQDFLGNVATITYVGLLGRNLGQAVPDLNAPPPNACGANAACYQPLRPNYAAYPNLGTIAFLQSHGESSYNALQMSIERRLRAGFTLNVNYQLAHALDDAADLGNRPAEGFGLVPGRIKTLDYGNSSLDIRQRIAGTADYALPFGANANGMRATFTKGWQFNLLGVWETGQPYTITNASNVSNTSPGGTADRTNMIGNGRLAHPGIAEFFNKAAFSAQTPGTLGNEARNQLHGPDYRHADISLFKVFPVLDRVNAEFRVEAFNVSNTANFATPNASLGGANFGAITSLVSFYTPRVLQFALKVTF